MEPIRRILFLDDNRNRFVLFRNQVTSAIIDWTPTARGAIELLGTREYQEIRLDHDLTEEQTQAFIQQRAARDGQPTGMAVALYIADNAARFRAARITVHSYNTTAAPRMVELLRAAGLDATYEPFMVKFGTEGADGQQDVHS